MAPKKSFVPPRKNTKKAGTSQGSGQQNQQIPDFLNDPNMLAYANLLAFNIANNQQMPTQESMPVDAQGSSTENEFDEMDQDDPKGKSKVEWDEDDEVRLAKAWCYHTENKKGVSRKRDTFWKDCLNHYVANGGDPTRTNHSLNSKWRKMMEQMSIYNGLFIQAVYIFT